MKNNPVFLEGIFIIGNKRITGAVFTFYITLLTLTLLISPGGKGNIRYSGFIPPDGFGFIIGSVLIFSSLSVALIYSVLFFKSEEISNWINYGRLTVFRVLAEKFLLMVFISTVTELISLPLIIYSARISAVPETIVFYSLFVIFIVLISSGYVWIIAGSLFSGNKVMQTVVIWIYLFIFLVISAKVLPDFNPVILLSFFNQIPQDNFRFNFLILNIKGLLINNLFLFLLIVFSAFFLSERRIKN